MATYNKFQDFVEQLATGTYNFTAGGDVIAVYLSNELPLATDTQYSDILEITNQNGYTAPVDVQNTLSEAAGTATVQGVSLSITASGGTVGPFQYVILKKGTTQVGTDPLIAWWDRGSGLTLQDGESFDILFDGAAVGIAGNIFTLA
jgi:hypothetical protein